MAQNFFPGIGRLSTDRYDFLDHYDGYSFRHNATHIDVIPPITINNVSETTVDAVIRALAGLNAGSFTATGDLSGTAASQKVVGINGIPINTNIVPSVNEVLIYTSGKWTPAPVPTASLTGSAGGDLTGSYPNPTVARINNATVPTGLSLTTGNVLQVGGSSSLTYAPVNLGAGATGYIAGILPTANQANQSMGGDVNGTTNAATVVKIQGVAVSNTSPSNNQILQYNSGTSKWTPSTISVSLSGDVTGTTTATTVVKMQGVAISNTAPTNNQVLQYNSGTSSWTPSTVSVTLSGDVTGSTTSDVVVSLSGAGGGAAVSAKTHIYPNADNTYNLGTTGARWALVRGAVVESGDLDLKDDERNCHWTIREERDFILAVNRINGKKYKLAMIEVSDHDAAQLAPIREILDVS